MRVVISNGISDLVFHDHRFHHVGEGWITNIQGWFGSPSVDVDLQQIPGENGSYTPSLMTVPNRTVTLSVAWRCESSLEVMYLTERLNGYQGMLTLTVYSPQGPRHAQCFVSDDIEPTYDPETQYAWFDIILSCPDPLKYGDPVSFPVSGGRVTVENLGNMPTYPIVTVQRDAGLSFVSVTDGNGHEVAWEGDGTASNVTLDFRTLMPTVGRVTVDDVFTVGPGSDLIFVSADNGAVSTVVVNPAWR